MVVSDGHSEKSYSSAPPRASTSFASRTKVCDSSREMSRALGLQAAAYYIPKHLSQPSLADWEKTLRNVARFLESKTPIRPKCPSKSSNIWCPSVTSSMQGSQTPLASLRTLSSALALALNECVAQCLLFSLQRLGGGIYSNSFSPVLLWLRHLISMHWKSL